MSSGAVLAVSLNAAVDVVYTADEFAVGRINQVREVKRMAGGKANNVARVLASLGRRVIATGFAGGSAGRFIEEDLRRQSIQTEFVESGAENRTCTTILDPVGRTVTEVRERGPVLTEADADRFIEQYTRLLGRAEMVIISGSLPPGIPSDFYSRLVSAAWRTTQTRCIVDASGEALENVVAAQPYLIKPNLEELEAWAGTRLPHDRAVLAAARELMNAGPLVVAVSMGARGLLMVSPMGVWRATPPDVQAVNTVGSGDSLVAGLAAGVLEGLPAEDVLRLAVGCGTANALTDSVAVVRPEDLARIRSLVRVEQIA